MDFKNNKDLNKAFEDFKNQSLKNKESLAYKTVEQNDEQKKRIAFVMDTLFVCDEDELSDKYDYDEFIFNKEDSEFDAIFVNFSGNKKDFIFC